METISTMQNLLKEERQQHILELLRRDGKVLAADLCRDLDVSEDTIRRDLRELSEMGQLQRVHGGALPIAPHPADYVSRHLEPSFAKEAIARTAMHLISPGQVVMIYGGTTTLHLARLLPTDLRATIITNGTFIADALSEHPLVEVLLIGGRYFKPSRVTVGAAAVEAITAIRADICFLGVCSIHPEIGLTTLDYEEAHVERAMIASSGEVVALAAAEKIGTAAPYLIGPLESLTHLVTEASIPAHQLAIYRERGITVVQA
jgi:DeoR/GlpR family transcriptional regulator of sugar metabolism